MSKKNDYNFDSFVVPLWPEPSKKSNGSWVRIWSILLNEVPNDNTDVAELEKGLSTDEITVNIHLNENRVTIEVHTLRWSLEDDLIIYSYKILREINDELGEIRTIQGQERDTWHGSLWYEDRYKLNSSD